MEIKNLRELNGEQRGMFTIVVNEEKNSFVITGRFMMGDAIIYHRTLDKVSEILSDIKEFGFDVELKESKIFKILFDKDDERVVMTSNEVMDNRLHHLIVTRHIKQEEYNDFIDLFSDNDRFEILEVEI
jgi:hypothetical protein